MQCPSCLTPTSVPVTECPHCGLSLKKLDSKYGTTPRHFRYVTDIAGIFSDPEKKRIESKIRAFEKKFSDCFFCVFTIDILPRTNPREYIFWLFNRCRFSPIEVLPEHNFSIVLFLSPSTGDALLTTGYGLHHLLTVDYLQDTLDKALPYFREGKYSIGTVQIVQNLMSDLRTISRAVKSSAKASPLDAPAIQPQQQDQPHPGNSTIEPEPQP